ncbi:MAG: 30S ribosomal protein S12 methylthiotransferase RimO [Deltaproteobacteria bacterium]
MTPPEREPIRVRILSLGCAKNSVDAEILSGLLSANGCRVVDGGRADVGIVNTCGFIREAKEESIGEILAMGRLKERGTIRRLVVAGCLAKRYREELPDVLPEVDLFVGPGDLPAVPALIRGLFSGEAPRVRIEGGTLPDEAYRHRTGRRRSGSAWLKILEGCSHRCAYCAIPAIRGPLKSRDRFSLLREARMLVREGAREICLIGQDITSYGADRGERGGLVRLLGDLCRIRGLDWIRLLYLFPSRIDGELIDRIAGEEKVCRYLDIPIQHVDPAILKRMGRPYGPAEIEDRIARLRDRMPGIFLRTSLIVGFPGETEAAFERLLRFVREVRLDYTGVFSYSREEGTPAYDFRPGVPERVKQERVQRILELQAKHLAARNRSMKGVELPVLVEETFGNGRALGRHAGQAPEVDGGVILTGYRGEAGRFRRVRVTGYRKCDLLAKPVDSASPAGILT